MPPTCHDDVMAASMHALDGHRWNCSRLHKRVVPIWRVHSVNPDDTGTVTFLGLGIGLGGPIAIAILILIIRIIHKRRHHQRVLAGSANDDPMLIARPQSIGGIPCPTSVARHGTLSPLHNQAGWGALSSNEALPQVECSVRPSRRKRLSKSLPKHFRQRGIHMKKLKHLSTVIESPRDKLATLTSSVVPEDTASSSDEQPGFVTTQSLAHAESADDVFVCPESPKAGVLPCFAIQSPGMYGASIATDANPRPLRSVSVGALSVPSLRSKDVVHGRILDCSRPRMHARSISLGAPRSGPPQGPVPDLPVKAPHFVTTNKENRQAVCISRMSISSQDSANSSVLVTSPLLTVHKRNTIVESPRVEEVVASDDSAQLHKGVNRQWQNPLITGPRPMEAPKSDPTALRKHASVHSNTADYCTERRSVDRLSSASLDSVVNDKNRLSVPQVATADRISISRVSSSDSLNGATKVHKVNTPRRASRHSSVSIYGSPAERKRTFALREVSGNIITPSRKASNSTEDSSRSSNGNPFQWDLPPIKPSALKGSPNARKGHRRQNCVRISTLTPQVLGPPPSRSSSPVIMQGIEEESADGEAPASPSTGALSYVSCQRPARPVSAASLANSLRVQTLRASLTPSSPTLSMWTAYQQDGLASHPSVNSLYVSQETRSECRQSQQSSLCSIPRFPSPSKATMSAVQRQQPMPEFYISRPPTDEPQALDSSQFTDDLASYPKLPSSPPLRVSKQQEYDPAWSSIVIPAPLSGQEYDPASPRWDTTEPELSSPYFPFAMSRINGDDGKTKRSSLIDRRQASSALPDTPPCSPKSMPEDFAAMFSTRLADSTSHNATKTLTSSNASALLASMDMDAREHIAGFPGAPILSPPPDSELPRALLPQRKRNFSVAVPFEATRPSLPPPSPSNKSVLRSPHKCKVAPQGPRSEPAKSVLKNAMALRRMNSEIDCDRNSESRRYTRLGREASPLLPWVCSPDPNESCNDMFDFGFGHLGADTRSDAEAGAEEEAYERSALDEIDMSDLDRCIDGAIAGFEAEPSPSGDARRRSSVWEDGENFWAQRPEFTFARSSPSYNNTTPIKKTLPIGDGLTTPMGRLVMPAPNSIGKTPKSLYDSEGFLRT